VVLADAVEPTARPEPKSAGSGELHGGVGGQHANQPPGGRVIFADRGPGVRRAERPLAGNDEVAAGSDHQVERAQLMVADQPRIAESAVAVEHRDGLVTLPGGTDPRGQVQLAVTAEAEPPRERDGADSCLAALFACRSHDLPVSEHFTPIKTADQAPPINDRASAGPTMRS